MANASNDAQILIYRIYPRDPIIAGGWYYSITCKGCGEPIHALEDSSCGTIPVVMTGGGIFRIPCRLCLHDDEYIADGMAPIEAQRSYPGFRPDRVSVSKASRKPLLPQFKDSNPIMGVGLIEDRPKAAAIVGRIITAWADIEVQSARLLAKIMGTNVAPAAAVFSSLRSSRAQADALDAAASVALNDHDHILFSAHMARKAALEKERNDLAHGCYGVAVNLPDAIVWVAQSDFITFTTSQEHGTTQKALSSGPINLLAGLALG
jgi:hypothetical protein